LTIGRVLSKSLCCQISFRETQFEQPAGAVYAAFQPFYGGSLGPHQARRIRACHISDDSLLYDSARRFGDECISQLADVIRIDV
jgi:hypothetical protein